MSPWCTDLTSPEADLRKRLRIRVGIFLLAVVACLLLLNQILKVVNTLDRLAVVEAERDQWQRAAGVIAALNVKPGSVVADIGAGAGYFALKLSRAVGPSGKVLAVDIQRLPLMFLWMRTISRSGRNISIRLGDRDDPHLPPNAMDGVLVANTYHEFANPESMLDHIVKSLRPGGRLVVLDRFPESAASPGENGRQHGLLPASVEDQLRRKRFEVLDLRDEFVNGPDGERWWLITAARMN